jgi:hypothetical protein
MMALFAHVMLHPWVHAIGMSKAAADQTSISSSSGIPQACVVAGDQCELCRVGHNATVTSRLPQTDLLNPHWVRTVLQAVNYASLQADRRIPSRAPPTL